MASAIPALLDIKFSLSIIAMSHGKASPLLPHRALREQIVMETITPRHSPFHSPALSAFQNSPALSPHYALSPSSTLNGSQRVMVIALNGNTSGRNAFHWALSNLLNPLTDLVVLLHVRPGTRELDDSNFVDFGDYLVEADMVEQEASRDLLRGYASRLVALGFSVRAIALRGEYGPEIVRKANELNATTVVVGTRAKKNGLMRLFFGGVSEYCVQNCRMPVVVVRDEMVEGLLSPGSSVSATPRSNMSPTMPPTHLT
jgi:nucleotide-binding universal stress UspA family protein